MFSPIPTILDELRAGRMIVLTDDESRENEGDLVLPAQAITPEAVNFMLAEARGYLCLSLTPADCDRLELHPQASVNTTLRGTAFTVSIDGHPRHGFTTGVSAAERARAIRLAIDPASGPGDFVRPGHINPLRSRDGGVLVRAGQTEGSIDLCRLAGLQPAAAIIEIMREDGEMARRPDLERFCTRHNLKMCSVAQVIEHRLGRESLVRRLDPLEGANLRTPLGGFTLYAYESLVDALPHLVLSVGGVGERDTAGRPVRIDEPVLVRVHRRDLLGDIFGDLDSSPEGPTSDTLRASMAAIQRAGRGAIVYLRTEGEGPTLAQRLSVIRRGGPDRDHPDLTRATDRGSARSADPASGLPTAPSRDGGHDATAARPLREYGVGGQILRDLGVTRLRLLTNHPRSMPGLVAFGLEVIELVPLP